MKTDEIHSDILQKIFPGNWSKRKRLPTERVLAEHSRVSRPVISLVLNQLRGSGQIRHVVNAASFRTKTPGTIEKADHIVRKTAGPFVSALGKGELIEPICARIAELSHQPVLSALMPRSAFADRLESCKETGHVSWH